MLIVVLDDDDDLVVGKYKRHHKLSSSKSACVANSRNNSHSRSDTSHNRMSPVKHTGGHREYSKSKHRKEANYRDATKEHRPHQQQHHGGAKAAQRPIINTQKLAQRLNNIKQDEHRHSVRSGSPTMRRITPERSPSLSGSMHSSTSESNFVVRPHAVIAKPVERRKKKRRVRPEPEGAPLDPADMDELDKLINSDEPIFSDYGTDEETETVSRPQRRPGFNIAAFAIGLGLNSNTMIKYAIIGTELQNIVRVSLKMVRKLMMNRMLVVLTLIHYHTLSYSHSLFPLSNSLLLHKTTKSSFETALTHLVLIILNRYITIATH